MNMLFYTALNFLKIKLILFLFSLNCIDLYFVDL